MQLAPVWSQNHIWAPSTIRDWFLNTEPTEAPENYWVSSNSLSTPSPQKFFQFSDTYIHFSRQRNIFLHQGYNWPLNLRSVYFNYTNYSFFLSLFSIKYFEPFITISKTLPILPKTAKGSWGKSWFQKDLTAVRSLTGRDDSPGFSWFLITKANWVSVICSLFSKTKKQKKPQLLQTLQQCSEPLGVVGRWKMEGGEEEPWRAATEWSWWQEKSINLVTQSQIWYWGSIGNKQWSHCRLHKETHYRWEWGAGLTSPCVVYAVLSGWTVCSPSVQEFHICPC